MSKKMFDMAELFGIEEARGSQIEGNEPSNSPFIPKKIDGYIHRKEVLSDLVAWIKIGGQDGLLLVGPTGCGKTSAITQVFAGLNQPVQRMNGHRRLEVSDLIGHFTVIDGDMVFTDGPLVTAMRLGMPFILDEFDMLDPGVAASLNTIIEEGIVSIPENGGEVVEAQDGFRFVATANTAGNGDRTGLYQATLRQNAATLDRFWVVEVDYPDYDQEDPILKAKAPNLPDMVRDGILLIAEEVRALFKGDKEGPAIELPLSTRSVVRWVMLTQAFQGIAREGISPIKHAADRAFLNRCEPETKVAIHEIIDRFLGEDA